MTYKDFIDQFKKALSERLDMPVFLMPITARNDTPHMELFFAAIEAAGASALTAEPNAAERLGFSAVFRSNGTHSKWLERTVSASRKLEDLITSVKMPFIVTLEPDDEQENNKVTLCALWRREARGVFEYPDNEESTMPVSFVERFSASIQYPARLVQETED